MNFAMAHSKLGRDRKSGDFSRGRVIWPAVFLIAVLPLMAACDSLLDPAFQADRAIADLQIEKRLAHNLLWQ